MHESGPVLEAGVADGDGGVEDARTERSVRVDATARCDRAREVKHELGLDVPHDLVRVVGQERGMCRDAGLPRRSAAPRPVYLRPGFREVTAQSCTDEATGTGDQHAAAEPVMGPGPCTWVKHARSVHRGTLGPTGCGTLAEPEVVVRARHWVVAMLPFWGACDFSAGTKVFFDSGDTAAPTGGAGSGTASGGGAGDGGSGTDGGEGTTDDGPDPDLADDDGDGVTVGEGDCDDGDPAVYPGATDLCDGRDEDCDGEIDEDARWEDEYEDNDTTAVFLGDLSGGGSLSVDALLDSASDVDRFAFQTDDSSFSLWDITVRLSNIPDGYRWRLRWIRPDGSVDEVAGAGSLVLDASDEAFVDDAGTWEVVVQPEDGAPCDARYLLTVDFSG